MASLYFDSDVQPDFAALLSSENHQVINARDLQRRTSTDAEHLIETTGRGLIIVTHNGNDFKTLCFAWRVWRTHWNLPDAPHAGVIAIRQQTRLPYPRAAQEIGALLERESSILNQVWYFDLTADDWVRQI